MFHFEILKRSQQKINPSFRNLDNTFDIVAIVDLDALSLMDPP